MTKTRFLPGLGLGLIVSAAAVSTALAGPWVTTNWKNTNLSQEECLEQVGRAIRAGGFEPLQSSQYSRFGGRGVYTVSVRCISEKQMAFFLVAGPDNAFTSRYLNAVLSNF